jgi:hypothetical protein
VVLSSDVDQNYLQGTFPTELGLLTALTVFGGMRNNLEGPIPTEFGLLTLMNFMAVWNNAGLCGPLVSVGNVGTSYDSGTYGTNLGTDCITAAPTSGPTSSPTTTMSPTTASPTTASSLLPCCEELRLNAIFCCIEARNPELAASICQECGTGK